MTGLTDFLLARIEETEAAAQEAINLTSIYHPATMSRWHWLVSADGQSNWFPNPHDPARVLALCAAHRKIVEAFEDERKRRDIYNRDYDGSEYEFNERDQLSRLSSNARCAGIEIALRALASTWADHDDYREEWA